jgi:hypothetical protein
MWARIQEMQRERDVERKERDRERREMSEGMELMGDLKKVSRAIFFSLQKWSETGSVGEYEKTDSVLGPVYCSCLNCPLWLC